MTHFPTTILVITTHSTRSDHILIGNTRFIYIPIGKWNQDKQCLSGLTPDHIIATVKTPGSLVNALQILATANDAAIDYI
jgi:prephenate dehydratase